MNHPSVNGNGGNKGNSGNGANSGDADPTELTLSGTDCIVASVSGAIDCEGVFSGNNSNQDLDGLFDAAYDWTEILKLDDDEGTVSGGGITLTVSNADKTWSVDTYANNSPVMFVLKGGPTFSAFLMDTDVLSGTWDTLSILKGNGSRGAGLSHWSIYSAGKITPPEVVPLPAAGLLLLGGLGGLAMLRKKRAA